MDKSPDAFRTISEVADWLDTPAHVLRFWESRFTQVKPVKRAGGRRYYRPSDMALLGGIKKLLHDDGMTIRGVQKLLREHGVKYVASLSPEIEGVDPILAPTPESSPIPPAPMAEMVSEEDLGLAPTPEETVVPFARPEMPPAAPRPTAAPSGTAPEVPPVAETPAPALPEPLAEPELAAPGMSLSGLSDDLLPPEAPALEEIPEELSADIASEPVPDAPAPIDFAAEFDAGLSTDPAEEAPEIAPLGDPLADAPMAESLFAAQLDPALSLPDEPAAKPGQASFDFASLSDAPSDVSEPLIDDAATVAESLAEAEMPAPELVPHEHMPPLPSPEDIPEIEGGFDAAFVAPTPERPVEEATPDSPAMGLDLSALGDLDDLSDPGEMPEPLPEEPAFPAPDSASPDLDMPDLGMPDLGMADLDMAPSAELPTLDDLPEMDLPNEDLTAPLAPAAPPLGATLNLPPDPTDDDPASNRGDGILGALNARKLTKTTPQEIAALLARAEALSARLAG